MQKDSTEILTPEALLRGTLDNLERDGAAKLRLPAITIMLGGYPAAGKGTATDTLKAELGIKQDAVVTSTLLTTPEALACKAAGKFVPDSVVIDCVCRELFKPAYQDGIILDGFPRTPVQAGFVKALAAQLGTGQSFFGIVLIDTPRKIAAQRNQSRAQEDEAAGRPMRVDAAPSVFNRRCDDYEKFTLPALESLSEQIPTIRINGANDRTAVTLELASALRTLKENICQVRVAVV